jgi:hypothetical protein
MNRRKAYFAIFFLIGGLFAGGLQRMHRPSKFPFVPYRMFAEDLDEQMTHLELRVTIAEHPDHEILYPDYAPFTHSRFAVMLKRSLRLNGSTGTFDAREIPRIKQALQEIRSYYELRRLGGWNHGPAISKVRIYLVDEKISPPDASQAHDHIQILATRLIAESP